MKNRFFGPALLVVLSCGLVLGQAAEYKVLWSFNGAPGDGAIPLGKLTPDPLGNLYGTTFGGGNSTALPCSGGGCGTIFRLAPNGDGTWSNTIIYSFCTNFSQSGCLDGAFPKSDLVFDADGNLYSTTNNGGGVPCPFDTAGCGTVFELSPPKIPGQAWTQVVLYSFCSSNVNSTCLDGAAPVSDLKLDAAGNLYGTTSFGGNGRSVGGTVFEMVHGQGLWKESVLYNFCSEGQDNICADGAQPMAGVTFDKAGNFYGTTELGGAPKGQEGAGALYELSPSGNGWAETVLLAAPFAAWGNPLGTVSIDPVGRIYSTFSAGGPNGAGGVFRYIPRVGRNLFWFNSTNGATPIAGVLIDSKNPSLYGTTYAGGKQQAGTVYRIAAPGQETVLYNFCSEANCADGAGPASGLIRDKAGNLYGTAKLGGSNGLGVVFEVVPQAPGKHGRLPSSLRLLLSNLR